MLITSFLGKFPVLAISSSRLIAVWFFFRLVDRTAAPADAVFGPFLALWFYLSLLRFFLLAFLLSEFVRLHSSQEAPPAGTINF